VTTLLKVQRPMREKAALVGIFSLGVFSTIASVVRLHSIRIYTESTDPFFDSVPINLWSMVEVNVGILCASIPSLKALFSKGQRERNGTAGYKYHSRGKSGVQDISIVEDEVRAGNEVYELEDGHAPGKGSADTLRESVDLKLPKEA
jgi:hypothetical protein